MTDGSSPELRIGDDERADALQALGEHLRAGRLDIDEYGERSARVTAARTRGDLMALFTDLPQPHPGTPAAAALPATTRRTAPATRSGGRLQQLANAAVPLSALVAIALFFTLDVHWVIFLAPAAMAILVGTFSGQGSPRGKGSGGKGSGGKGSSGGAGRDAKRD